MLKPLLSRPTSHLVKLSLPNFISRLLRDRRRSGKGERAVRSTGDCPRAFADWKPWGRSNIPDQTVAGPGTQQDVQYHGQPREMESFSSIFSGSRFYSNFCRTFLSHKERRGRTERLDTQKFWKGFEFEDQWTLMYMARLYSCVSKSDIAPKCFHRESNLISTLSSNKD